MKKKRKKSDYIRTEPTERGKDERDNAERRERVIRLQQQRGLNLNHFILYVVQVYIILKPH